VAWSHCASAVPPSGPAFATIGGGRGSGTLCAAARLSWANIKTGMNSPVDPHSVTVVAGALYDPVGHLLIAQRPAGKALAGRWEFPGGKLHPGESPFQGLRRELQEELGITVHDARPLMRYAVDYPDRRIWLDMWIVTDWSGEPRGLDGQAIKWVRPHRLVDEDILEADQPIVAALASASSG